VDMCPCVDTNQLQASALEDAFSELLRDAQSDYEYGAVVARGECFKALADSADNVVTW